MLNVLNTLYELFSRMKITSNNEMLRRAHHQLKVIKQSDLRSAQSGEHGEGTRTSRKAMRIQLSVIRMLLVKGVKPLENTLLLVTLFTRTSLIDSQRGNFP